MRVMRCFGFVDLCGFTRFNDSRGDDEAVEVLRTFRAAVREIASDHDVRVDKWLGDGAMFVSTKNRPVIATVLRLVERFGESDSPLALRAGVAAGPVILFEGEDYVGGAVNLAARLCAGAAPRVVLAPADLATDAPAWAEVVPVGTRAVSGFELQVPVVRLSVAEARPLASAL